MELLNVTVLLNFEIRFGISAGPGRRQLAGPCRLTEFPDQPSKNKIYLSTEQPEGFRLAR